MEEILQEKNKENKRVPANTFLNTPWFSGLTLTVTESDFEVRSAEKVCLREGTLSEGEGGTKPVSAFVPWVIQNRS